MNLINRFKDFIKGRGDEKVSEPIDQSNVEELSELFVEFCDEFDFNLKELNTRSIRSMSGSIDSLLYLILGSNLNNEIFYGIQNNSNNRIVDDVKGDFDYVFFAIRFSVINRGRSVNIDSKIIKMLPLMREIYKRIISMDYKCRLNSYRTSDNLMFVYMIGKDSRLKNICAV